MRYLSLSLGYLLLSSVARAEDPKVEVEGGREVRYEQRQELGEDAFLGLELQGELVKPSVTVVSDLRHQQFQSFVRLRKDFTPEMAASVDEVK